MITVSKDIISKSVAPNKAMDMMRRDSDSDDYGLPKHKRKNKRKGKRNNNDPYPQISIEDLNQDSDPEESVSQQTNNNNNNNNNNPPSKATNKSLTVTTTGPSGHFDKQDVTPTPAAKSMLSAMMEPTREALIEHAEFYQQRMTIAQARYQPNETEVIKSQVKLSDDPTVRTKRPTVHDMDEMQPYQGRAKRGTLRGNQLNPDYEDSSDDSDVGRINHRGQASGGYDRNDSSGFDTIPVYVEEFKNDQPFKITIYKVVDGKQKVNFPKTANDFIVEVFEKCGQESRILKGTVSDYVLKEWDDDEVGDLTMDGTAKMNEMRAMDALCICYAGPGNGTVGPSMLTTTPSLGGLGSLASQAAELNQQRSLSPDAAGGGSSRASRSVTLDHLNQAYSSTGGVGKVFVRIQVPGPMNDTFTFQIENESAALCVRDLCVLLNRKKSQVYFSPQYFDFYYQGLTSSGLEGPINKQMKVLDLKKKELVILPKIINEDGNEEKARAFAFPLVKLANEVSQFRAFKIKNNNKKARLLSVDRFRIVKQSLEDDKFKIMRRSEKVPIEITAITSIKINSDNNAQFTLHYNHPSGGNRKHIYELGSKQECSHCVSKIKYLVTLRRLQG